jgi:hypothetical protein
MAEEFIFGFTVENMWITCAKTAPNLCVHWGNAGDAIAGPSRSVAMTWHNAPRALCMEKELKLPARHTSDTGK